MSGLETEPRTARVKEPGNVVGPRQQWLHLGLLTSALGYAVFQHGARGLLDWNISLLIIGAGTIVYWVMTPVSEAAPRMEKLPGWLALLVPAYVVFQLIPLPIFLVRILSPERGQILERLHGLMPTDAFAAISISPATTFAHLFRIIGYLLVFLLVREVASRSPQRWVVVIPLIGIAGLQAAFGLMQNANGAVVAGSYWNKNHFAGLLEMILPIAIAYAIALLVDRRSQRNPANIRVLAACLVLSAVTLMLVAIIYSLSKMGFVACLAGLFFMASVASVATITGRKKWWIVSLLGAFFLLMFVFIPPDQLASAFENSLADKTGEGRLPIWNDSLHLLTAYPLTGSGLGTYDTAFLKHQTALLEINFEFAHNDYLQLAAELGVLGFLTLAGFVLAIFVKTLRSATRHFDQNTRYLARGCAGGIAAIGFHSLTDFNMYIPANALVLAWILGIVASFPSSASRLAPVHTLPGRVPFRGIAPALGCLLLIYAPAWILLEGEFRDNPQAEIRFCRFGVCDTDALVASETARHAGSVASVPAARLVEALRRDSAAPLRWCDLGDALLKSGHIDQARYCFSSSLALAPNIPPVQLRAANFYSSIHDQKRGLEQTSNVLAGSTQYDDQIFDKYGQEKIPVADILANGLPRNRRASQSYLRYLMNPGNSGDVMTVWDWILSQHYADDRIAREYLGFLFRDHRYEAAAQAWARYLGDRRNGYREWNWVFNGDFEAKPSGVDFDWRMEDLNEDVTVTLDPSVAHTGTHSLRIQFGGKKNVDYAQTSQTVFVKPGIYRFAAFVRTEGVTTDQGIGLHIFDPELSSNLDTKTEQLTGTTNWKKVEKVIAVPKGTRLLMIQVIRPASLRFDSHVAGTAWIDTVSLSKVE